MRVSAHHELSHLPRLLLWVMDEWVMRYLIVLMARLNG